MKGRIASAAVFLSLLSAAAPATAATDLRLSDVRVDAQVRSVDLVVTAENLPAGMGLDPASVVATAGDRVLPTGAVSPFESTKADAPTVLLVVDTSGSMAGQPMADAQQAISTFIASAPSDVRLGLMSFSTKPTLLVRPTVDRSPVLGAVTKLQAQGETSLYDAVLAGVSSLGGSGDRRVVVLSDGGDTRSRASLEQALRNTRASGVAVDAIGFNTGESVQAVLKRIADSGGGQVHEASSSEELASALATTVRSQATALTVRVLVPRDLRGAHTLTVTASTGKGQLSATTPVALGTAGVAAARPAGWWGTREALLTGLAAIALSLLLTALVLIPGRDRQRKRTQDILQRFTTRPAAAPQQLRTASPVARTALDLAGRVVASRNLHERSALRLARAAVALTPAEWLLLQAGVGFGLALLLVLFGGNLLLALVGGTVLGVVGPSAYLTFRGGRRQKAFEDKLPDALQMTAGSLSAGYSLAQALDGLVREGSEPMATEIGKALAESRLGVPVETTLEGVATRMRSKDFSWVVMAIRVQREVGGNLGGVLTTVSATMRERAMLRRHVRGLSAEGRLSAYILIGLPVFLVLYMFAFRREYLAPLYTTGIGLLMITAAVLLMSFGSFLMSRIVKVEV